jgi:predicted nucleotide-binding protein
MPPKRQSTELAAMAPIDPRLPLKISRLREALLQIDKLQSREPLLNDPEFEAWERRVQELLKEVFGSSGYLLRFRQINFRPISYTMGGPRRWHADPAHAWRQALPEAARVLREAVEEADILTGASSVSAPTSSDSRPHGNKVFVVHGHDDAIRETVARFLERLDVEAIILHEKPSEGRTVIEKLEHYADADFAVVLLTPDDLGSSKTEKNDLRERARQNVILELGYFVGRLGRKNVCALYKGSVELPSDYLGVVYVALDEAGAWRLHLARELKSNGFRVDMNRAL